jgi:hypothetical protein
LWNGCFQDQRWTQQTEEDNGEDGEAQCNQDHTIAGATLGDRSVAQQRKGTDRSHSQQDPEHRPGHAEDEVSLLEEQRRILEQKAKDCLEH